MAPVILLEVAPQLAELPSPKAFRPARKPTATSSAISPYSMAVVPRRSRAKRRTSSLKRSIPGPLLRHWPRALEQVPQHRLQRLVGRRHRIVAEPFRADPNKLLSLPRRHLALPLATRIQGHQEVKRLVAVT